MFKIDGDTIHLTRGDIALIEVKAKNDDKTDYVFKKDDVVRLNVFKSKDYGHIVLTKDVKVEKESTSVDIPLTSKETTIEQLINKPKKYCYEVILNPDTNEQTIIGYDTNGEKEFWLYPEGKESDN